MRKVFVMVVSVLVLCSLSFAGNWVLNANQLPANLADLVQQAGGTLIQTFDELGIAVAEFADESDARSLESSGLEVMPDVELNWLPGNEKRYAHTEGIGDDEPYYIYQWHLPTIQADLAWDEGVTGAGVRVAVLDTGIWYYHSDLDDNIDYGSSTSFVPDEPYILDEDGHGTHVSGIIAAEDNGWGSIGVAPNATIIAVKVLNKEGWGYWSWILNGIIHAVYVDADIINMSLGGYLKKNGYPPNYTAADAAAIKNLIKKVVNWAISRDVLVVIAGGNEGVDLDHIGNIIEMPGQCGSGLVVSATGPVGLQDFDHFAHYSCYGQGTIDLAAPGGDWLLYPNPGYWYDMVFSTFLPYPGNPINTGWAWAAGTSQAAPNVCGVAALVLSLYPDMNVQQLENHLIKTADDLGKPGNDDFYGKGRINAYRAVTE